MRMNRSVIETMPPILKWMLSWLRMGTGPSGNNSDSDVNENFNSIAKDLESEPELEDETGPQRRCD